MSVLAEIVARKRVDLAARRRPIAELERVVEPTTRSLAAALARPGLRFVMEHKRASPSEGVLRDDFDSEVVTVAYRDVADAISVLTDTPYFRGGFDDLRAVRARVAQPILAKDFVVEPYQLLEARVHGADAALLMLSVLDDETYRACAEMAARLGMDCLTEVHDEDELDRALRLDARIVGINNRDLRTLKVDRDTTSRLAPRVPRDRVRVCESGIGDRAHVLALAEHVDAFLVGSHLVKAARTDLEARALAYGRVKICGLRSTADANKAYEAGASLGGLVFAPASPRALDDETARDIVSPMPLVGVFVDAPIERVASLARSLSLHAVQLHGDESPAYIAALRPHVRGAIWKAVRVRDRIPLLAETGADALLLDAHVDSARGGTGRRFDWSLVVEHPERTQLIVAGGIEPANAREAARLGVHMLDVSSGVESAPGAKDETKLRALFSALRDPLGSPSW